MKTIKLCQSLSAYTIPADHYNCVTYEKFKWFDSKLLLSQVQEEFGSNFSKCSYSRFLESQHVPILKYLLPILLNLWWKILKIKTNFPRSRWLRQHNILRNCFYNTIHLMRNQQHTSVSDPHKFSCGSGSMIPKMSIWIRVRIRIQGGKH